MDVPADLHVVEHGHALEQRDVLEGARDPELGALVRLAAPVMSRAVEADAAARGRVDAADAVEDAGLARAVGADDGEELAALDLEAHPGEGGDAAEAQVQVVQSEKSHALVHPLVTEIEAGSGLERSCETGRVLPTFSVPGRMGEKPGGVKGLARADQVIE